MRTTASAYFTSVTSSMPAYDESLRSYVSARRLEREALQRCDPVTDAPTWLRGWDSNPQPTD